MLLLQTHIHYLHDKYCRKTTRKLRCAGSDSALWTRRLALTFKQALFYTLPTLTQDLLLIKGRKSSANWTTNLC